jgi:hypothetical protein
MIRILNDIAYLIGVKAIVLSKMKKPPHTECDNIRTPRKYTIEDLKKSAQSREGKCLSDSFTKLGDSYTWECAEGYRWTANGRQVLGRSNGKGGSWCPTCARDRRHRSNA